MKKYRLHIILVTILALLALFLNEYRKGSTLGRRTANFSVTDTRQVNEVIITGEDARVELRKENGKWLLNTEYEPGEKAVEMLLQTLERLRITGPAPLAIQEDLKEKLHEESVRVDLRVGRRLRTYYVYSAGPDESTYMIMDGGSRAFEMEVVGFDGNVASLFIADEGFWRSNIIFNYRPSEIAEVKVIYPGNGDESFLLRQSADRDLSLFSYPQGKKEENLKDSLAIRYLANFLYVPFERFAGREERALLDSLLRAEPDYLIRVTGHNGKTGEVRLHKIPTGNGVNGDLPDFDIFRLHGLINDGNDMIVLPWHSVDLLLRTYSWFSNSKR